MNLTIKSQFRPFTFDEMVKPLLMYKEAYDKVEEDYTDLAKQTETFRDVANRENSPIAYAQFKNYSDRLNNALNSFNSKGLNDINTRRRLLGLKRDYESEIGSISRASEAMKEANALRDSKGEDAIFKVSRYNSVDDFLHGKQPNNGYTSRSWLTKQAATITEAAMAEAMKDPEFKKVANGQFWKVVQHSGGSYADLKEAFKQELSSNPIANNKFSEIRQGLFKKVGIDEYDAEGQRAVVDAIDTGMYTGLDKPTTQFMKNEDHLNPLQSFQLKQAKKEAEWKKIDRMPLDLGNGSYYDTVNGFTYKVDDDGNWIYTVNSRANGSTRIPEIIDGKPTGRQYDLIDKKYYNEDGTLAAQGQYKEKSVDTAMYSPLFFDAWSSGASSGFQLKTENDQDSGPLPWKDTNHIKYSDIHGSKAKKAIRDYVYRITGTDGGIDIPEGTITEIANILDITRDRDWFSDNHFAIRVPGTDDEGNIISNEDFAKAMKAINEKLTSTVVSELPAD